MFDYYKKIDSLNHLNRLLLVGCGCFFLLTLWLSFALIKAPSRLEIWLAPSIAANGGLIKPHDIPNEYVHGFVSALFPTLHSWSSKGEAEYSKNLGNFHYYFTPRFRELMHANRKALREAGLFSRTQTASLYRFLEPNDVTKIGDGLWEVHLVLRITQKLNEHSTMIIADKVVDYHLRVAYVGASKLLNPFSLALDGYSQPEVLARDLLNQNKKEGAV